MVLRVLDRAGAVAAAYVRGRRAWLANIAALLGFVAMTTLPGLLFVDYYDSAIGQLYGVDGTAAVAAHMEDTMWGVAAFTVPGMVGFMLALPLAARRRLAGWAGALVGSAGRLGWVRRLHALERHVVGGAWALLSASPCSPVRSPTDPQLCTWSGGYAAAPEQLLLCPVDHTGLYSETVKTAISLPDDVFNAVTLRAAELGISRSQLFVRAARHYLDELDTTSVTVQINDALNVAGADDSSAAAAAAGRTRLSLDESW